MFSGNFSYFLISAVQRFGAGQVFPQVYENNFAVGIVRRVEVYERQYDLAFPVKAFDKCRLPDQTGRIEIDPV